MRIVVALDRNALLRPGDPMTVPVQRRNVRIAGLHLTRQHRLTKRNVQGK
jgi:carbamate kinase